MDSGKSLNYCSFNRSATNTVIDPTQSYISVNIDELKSNYIYSLDITGKTINAGIATSRFSSKENNPKKIVAQCFSPIATYIAAKFIAIVKPAPVPQKN